MCIHLGINDGINHCFYSQDMKGALERLQTMYGDIGPANFLILVLLPMGSSHIYRQIKQIGDIELGVKTQCMV